MRKILLLLVFVLALIAALPAFAITWGEPDGNLHPHVVLIVFDDATGPAWRCSGTMLSPTVVLTAGHCTDGALAARIWPDSDLTGNPEYPFSGATSYDGVPHTHPGFGFANFPNTGDVGVVVLSEPYHPPIFGALPPIGDLDQLATRRGLQNTLFEPVGYGLQQVRPNLQAERIRFHAFSNLVNLRSALTDGWNLHTSNNAGQGNGRGGTCFGDSGGPVFYAHTNVIAAVTSFGLNQNCVGADFAYRMDTSFAQDWVRSFL